MKRILMSIAAVAAVSAVAAGCGGGSGNSSSGAGQSSAPATPSGGGATGGAVMVSKSGLGQILTDSSGRTLYMFAKDSGPTSMCAGACATAWPPLTTSGKSTAGSGVTASRLGQTTRSDGKTQVTYSGHPLYYFSGDNGPGQTNGNGVNAFGAQWFALSATGAKAQGSGSSSGGSGTSSGGSQGSSGGGGYGY